jgi:hypothetical protein
MDQPSTVRSVVVHQEIAAILGPRATAGLATSALPGAPVLAEPQRRQHLVLRRLLDALPGHGR